MKQVHCISIQALNSVLSWSTFKPKYFWLWCNKLCTSAFGNYLPFFSSPLKLPAWMGIDAHFLFFPEIFKTRLWLGHSRTFTELSISYSCCVFRSIVLLEGEPSAQSKDLKALDCVFIKTISIFWCIELFFYSDESLCPCCWKTAPQHEAATSTLYFGWYSAYDELYMLFFLPQG